MGAAGEEIWAYRRLPREAGPPAGVEFGPAAGTAPQLAFLKWTRRDGLAGRRDAAGRGRRGLSRAGPQPRLGPDHAGRRRPAGRPRRVGRDRARALAGRPLPRGAAGPGRRCWRRPRRRRRRHRDATPRRRRRRDRHAPFADRRRRAAPPRATPPRRPPPRRAPPRPSPRADPSRPLRRPRRPRRRPPRPTAPRRSPTTAAPGASPTPPTRTAATLHALFGVLGRRAEDAVLHYDDGAREWTREPVELAGAQLDGFDILALDASGTDAWLLGADSARHARALPARRRSLGGAPADAARRRHAAARGLGPADGHAGRRLDRRRAAGRDRRDVLPRHQRRAHLVVRRRLRPRLRRALLARPGLSLDRLRRRRPRDLQPAPARRHRRGQPRRLPRPPRRRLRADARRRRLLPAERRVQLADRRLARRSGAGLAPTRVPDRLRAGRPRSAHRSRPRSPRPGSRPVARLHRARGRPGGRRPALLARRGLDARVPARLERRGLQAAAARRRLARAGPRARRRRPRRDVDVARRDRPVGARSGDAGRLRGQPDGRRLPARRSAARLRGRQGGRAAALRQDVDAGAAAGGLRRREPHRASPSPASQALVAAGTRPARQRGCRPGTSTRACARCSPRFPARSRSSSPSPACPTAAPSPPGSAS